MLSWNLSPTPAGPKDINLEVVYFSGILIFGLVFLLPANVENRKGGSDV
jgi:hypothetical protein